MVHLLWKLFYSAVPLLVMDPREIKINAHMKTLAQIFVVVLTIIVKRCKQPKCPLTDEWVSEMKSIHTVEYYLAMKRNEVLI